MRYGQGVLNFAVFDIDGVLADVRHRLRFVTRQPKDWETFFGLAHLDEVLENGRAMVHESIDAGHNIWYSTGRPERCRQDTLAWLERHDFPNAPLHMRGENDLRPGRVTKLEVARLLRNRGTVEIIVDDDPVVVEALRDDGFNVVHATWMGLSDDPSKHEREAQELLFLLQEEGRF